MNRSLIILIFCTITALVQGQSENYSSLNMFNYMYYNPGYAGDGNDIEAKGIVREQWLGFEGLPQTKTFSIDAPFKLFGHRHGVGFSANLDQIGFFSNNSYNFSYAYRKPLTMGELGIGLGVDFTNHSYDGTWRYPDSENANTTSGTDPGVPQNKDDKPWIIDGNIGVFYRSDNLFMSFSIRNLFQSSIKYNSTNEGGTTTNINPSYIARQGFFGIGYDYQLPNPMFSFKPGLFLASDFSSTMISASGILTYNNRIFGGIEYKPVDAIVAIVGLNLPSGLQIAVSYDMTTSKMAKASSGSFEFMLGYSFSLDMDKDIRKYKSVRFL